ncbi:MAG TPA: hypothetical protein VJ732_19135 [Bryobacteraceae bacterium]|nr:hypothetical protein [Bryobacteraceae bacterium]
MLGRREFLNWAAAACFGPRLPGTPGLCHAFLAAKSNRLGPLRFCRASGPGGLELVQAVLGETVPVSVSARAVPAGIRATLRYRNCVVSYRQTAGDPLAVLHGANATLAIFARGYAIYPSDDSPVPDPGAWP